MKAVGIILAGGNNEGRLERLTVSRAAAALPIGGCYRAIDFTLSNMSNSGIGKVAVLTQYNARSLRDHLASAKWWDFGRKRGGLFVFTPYISSTNSSWFRGTADSIYQNMAFLMRSNVEYVVIASGDSVYKMDYREVLEHHVEQNADITVVYQERKTCDLRGFGVIELNDAGRIISFEEKPESPRSENASLGIYVISRRLLIDLLNENIAKKKYDFVRDFLIGMVGRLNICGFEFKGYWQTISTGVSAYYKVNMDFLQKELRDTFFNEFPYIETKAKDEPPVKYNVGAEITDTVAGGGTIFNGKVEHSVIFRKVYTSEGSVIRNSIVMEGCRIGKNCWIENAILDKDVVVSDGIKIIGQSADNPVIIQKGLEI